MVQTNIRLHAIDFGDFGIVGPGEQVKPLTGSRTNVETNTAGVVLEQWHDLWCAEFTRTRAKEGPELCKPYVFECFKGEKGLELEASEQGDDGGEQVVGRAREDPERL